MDDKNLTALDEMNRAYEKWQEHQTLKSETKPENARTYPHYFKRLPRHTTHVDVYRVITLFDVPAGPVDHAVKKLLCLGKRGGKNYRQDLTEARNSLNRALEMLDEDEA